jgi:hypothetical protein
MFQIKDNTVENVPTCDSYTMECALKVEEAYITSVDLLAEM